MRSFLLGTLFCLACIVPALAQSNTTFLKIVTNFRRGYTICPTGDGNLYVGGAVIGRTVVLKMTPDGNVISSHFLDFSTGNLDNVSELIVDSEGMIVGCGTQGTGDLRRGFVFRYNPTTSTVLWAGTMDDDVATLNGLLEKSPGGNYLVYGETFANLGSDATLLQIDRNTGVLLIPLTKRYNLSKAESFTAIVARDSAFYAVGQANNGTSIFTELFSYSALTRLDKATATPTWTRLSGAPITTPAYLRGRDLVLDGDALLTTFSGNQTDPSLSTSTCFLQKHRLDGTIAWLRQYNLTEWTNEVTEEIIAVPDGYVLYGRASNAGGGSLFVLKTDQAGRPVWVKKLKYGANDGFAQIESQQGQIIFLGNHLFFTATTEQANSASRMLLVKINADGSMNDDCTSWQNTPVIASNLSDLPDASVTLQVSSGVIPFSAAPNTTALPVTANVATICAGEIPTCTDTLDLGPEVVLCRDSTVIFHAGSGFASYLWQDGSTDSTYSATLPDVYWVAVTDTCGNTQRDSVLLTVSLLADTQFPDTIICPSEILTYTVAGFDVYAWTPTFGLNCDTCPTVIIQPNITTTYALLASTTNGCVLTDTFTVVVDPTANVQLPDATICPGESLTYTVPGFDAYQWTPAAGLSCTTCDTVVVRPLTTTTYNLLAQSNAGCRLIDTFTVTVRLIASLQLPDNTICPGQSVAYEVFGFDAYLWMPAAGLNCDTCATVTITPTATTTYSLLAQNSEGCTVTDSFTIFVSIIADIQLPDTSICPGESLTYTVPGFASYGWTPAAGLNCTSCATVIIQPNTTTTYSLLAQNSDGCVANDTFTVVVNMVADLALADTSICPGESLTYTAPGFDSYLWTPATGLDCDTCATVAVQPATTTTYNLLAQTSAGCVRSTDFTVTVLPPPTRTEVIRFLPGDSVLLGGIFYHQPDTVVLTLPATAGCDTLVTYILQLQTTVNITCPANITVSIPAGDTQATVDYILPTAITNCPDGGLTFTRLNSLPNSNIFPLGLTEVCYLVTDACGNSDTCCFKVLVLEQMTPCDTKTSGCLLYELLSIKLDSIGNRRYTIRVVNNCTDALVYTAFAVPAGIMAVAPAANSVFTAASGRQYLVNNPNFSPFYSIRFKAQPGSVLALGAADIFEYVLPQQSAPAYIHVITKLANNVSYPSLLNTFHCPVQPYPNVGPGAGAARRVTGSLRVFPNPTDGVVFADLSAWVGQTLELRVFSAQGQLCQHQTVVADYSPQLLDWSAGPANGLYFLEVRSADGQQTVQRFMVQH